MSEISEWREAVKAVKITNSILKEKRQELLVKFAFILKTVYPYKDDDMVYPSPHLFWSEDYIPHNFTTQSDAIYEHEGFVVFDHECNVDRASCPGDYNVKIPVGLFDLTEEELIQKGKERAERREKIKNKIEAREKQSAKDNRREFYESLKNEFEPKATQ